MTKIVKYHAFNSWWEKVGNYMKNFKNHPIGYSILILFLLLVIIGIIYAYVWPKRIFIINFNSSATNTLVLVVLFFIMVTFIFKQIMLKIYEIIFLPWVIKLSAILLIKKSLIQFDRVDLNEQPISQVVRIVVGYNETKVILNNDLFIDVSDIRNIEEEWRSSNKRNDSVQGSQARSEPSFNFSGQYFSVYEFVKF